MQFDHPRPLDEIHIVYLECFQCNGVSEYPQTLGDYIDNLWPHCPRCDSRWVMTRAFRTEELEAFKQRKEAML